MCVVYACVLASRDGRGGCDSLEIESLTEPGAHCFLQQTGKRQHHPVSAQACLVLAKLNVLCGCMGIRTQVLQLALKEDKLLENYSLSLQTIMGP